MNNIPNGYKLVKVTSTGVQFGNAWHSHESITGYSADQLNQGNCCVTGGAYMKWLSEETPPQPIYDEAKELQDCRASWEKHSVCVVFADYWQGWKSRAKVGEVGHE